MKSSVEPLEGNKVKLSVTVEEAEIEKEVDAAFRRIAKEVRIPGFRPGKAPRRILEARVGVGPARADALQHAIPEYYEQAVREHDVDIIASPDIDLTAGEDEGGLAFDAVVQVRPTLDLAGYENLRVTVDSPVPTDDDVTARIDQLREQNSDLATADRAARDGDQVSIDITGSQDDEPLSGLTAQDYLYEVGSGTVVAAMDDQLRGAKAGDILSFTADHPDPDEDPVDFRILVKEVKEKVLPEPDDAFAADASEFETIDELRADIRTRLTLMGKVQGQMALQQKTSEAVADLVTDDVPEPMVDQEMQQRLQDMALRLQAQGVDLQQYLEATGQDQEAFVAQLRETAEGGVRLDLALRAVADAEAIEATDDDLEAELAEVAERVEQPIEVVREQFESSGTLPAVRSDIRKRKALEWLVEHVEIVDGDGNPIDRALFTVDDEEDAAGSDEDAVGDAPATAAAETPAAESTAAETPADEPETDTDPDEDAP